MSSYLEENSFWLVATEATEINKLESIIWVMTNQGQVKRLKYNLVKGSVKCLYNPPEGIKQKRDTLYYSTKVYYRY